MFFQNPLLRRELRERWRRPITFLLLGFYSCVVAWIAYSSFSIVAIRTAISPVENAAQGRDFFFQFSALQLILGMATGLLFAAPTLAQERERKSLMDYVLAGLSPAQIVVAKFGSVVSLLLVLELICVPILSLCYLFGGVSPLELGATNALILACASACAALGLNVSAGAQSVGRAMSGALVALLVCGVFGAPFLLWLLSSSPFVILPATLFVACAPFLLLPFSMAEVGFSALKEPQSRVIVAPPTLPILPAPIDARKADVLAAAPSIPTRVERVELSPLERWLDNFAAKNAITQREWRVKLRGVGSQALGRDMIWDGRWQNSLLILIFWTAMLYPLSIFFEGFPLLWRTLAGLTTLVAMFQTTILAASAFTSERAQKMLTTLQLTTLSPLEIVLGKIAFPLLWTARGWLGILLICGLFGALFDPFGAATLLLAMISALVLASTVGVTLSLLCQGAGVAASGSAVFLLTAFVLTPSVFVGYFYKLMPLPMRLWLTPLQNFFWGVSPKIVMPTAFFGLQIALNCALLTFVLGALTTFYLARLRGEEENAGLMQRDLNKSWG